MRLRPLIISGKPNQDGWRTWSTFNAIIGKFQTNAQWVGHRNKLKALMTALRNGPDATQEFTTAYGELPPISGYQTARTGWIAGGRCPYFDPLEALDFFVALDDANDSQNGKED